jgi:exopolysaccharide biosynthesis polyprenyl glycosylphosphotransferase
MYRFTSKTIVPAYRVLDTSVAIASLVLALIVMNLPEEAGQLGSFLEMRITLKSVLLLSILTFAWPLIFATFGLYRLNELRTAAVEFSRIAKACTLGTSFALVVSLTSASGAFGILSVLIFWLTVTIGTTCARAIGRTALRTAARLERNVHYVVIVGTGPRAVQLYRQIAERTSHAVLGFVDTTVVAAPLGAAGPPFLGTIDELERILATQAVDAVHIGLPVKSCYAAIEQAIKTCASVGVESSYHANIFGESLGRPRASDADHVVARKVVADDYRLWAKRVIDICGALLGLALFSPLMLTAAAAIKWTSPGPIFFTQERFGFNRRRFRMYKFRTMVRDAETRQSEVEHLNEAKGPIFKIRNDPRLTPVGPFLRKTSIDELPQFLNVLRGEMSLVGPRPMSVRDVSRFPEAALMRRFSVKPGLTCLWQINGRSNSSFERWIEQDLEYIDRWSLALDLLILAKTVPTVVKGSGAV